MVQKEEAFDLIVIGGGTAGLRTALYGASHGHKTAMFEPKDLGGTCLNTGCIPTKAMLHAAAVYRTSLESEKYGIIANPKFDFAKIMDRVLGIVQSGQDHIGFSIKNDNLTLFKERAVFVNKNTVVTGDKRISGKKFIICTGARPIIPAIKGIEKVPYMVSDDVLKLRKLPESITIIGGGYISIELSTFFSTLGTKVNIIEREERILNALDSDLSQLLDEESRKKGIKIYTSTNIEEISYENNTVKIKCVGNKKESIEIKSEMVLISAGRGPYTYGLNLKEAGVKIGDKGEIIVDDTLKTSNSSIYAIGDVTGRAPFAHAAKRESHIALINALENKKEKMNFDLVPWAVFSDPPASGIGLSEKQAIKNKIKYKIAKAGFSRAGRATVTGDVRGFAKILIEPKKKNILGASVIGPRADDLIHEIAALMVCKGTLEDLRSIIHIHPTLSEVYEAVKEN